MGLLDLFSAGNADDPQSQAQMAAAMALLQAGGPSRTPVSLAQALGGATQSYQQTLQNAKDRQLQQDGLRSRMAFENGRMSSSAMRDSLPRLASQVKTGLPLQNNFDAWQRALQDDSTKPYPGSRAYFPDFRPSIGDSLEIGTSDNSNPSFCFRGS